MALTHDLDRAFDCFEQGRAEEALRLCEAILANDPDFYVALYLAGSVLAELGRNDQARVRLEKAIAVHPEKKVAHFNLAKVLLDLSQTAAACARLENYLALDPGDAEAFAIYGGALLDLGRTEDARAALDRAVALAPHFALGWYNRGNLAKVQARYDEAVADYHQAITCDRHVVAAHLNCGVALHALGRLEEALACYDEALRQQPASADAWSNRGISLHGLARFAEALESFGRAIALAPDHREARANRAYTSLALGDFAHAWDDYEYRLQSRDYRRIALGAHAGLVERIKACPRRDDLLGRHVILFGEQGVGDIIMFASMIADVQAVAARVDLVVEHRLCALMRHSFPAIHVMPIETCDASALPAEATCLFIGSLGSVLRRSPADFPQKSFLVADAHQQRAFSARVSAPGRKRVGISWAGGLAHTRQAVRTLALDDLLDLVVHRDDLALVSLQHGQDLAFVQATAQRRGLEITAFAPAELHDLGDLAALIASLDGVVTVQNTNVHICGALGVPCLAILPPVPEWRYGLSGDQMAWYGSVELLRRTTLTDLRELEPKLRARLESLLA